MVLVVFVVELGSAAALILLREEEEEVRVLRPPVVGGGGALLLVREEEEVVEDWRRVVGGVGRVRGVEEGLLVVLVALALLLVRVMRPSRLGGTGMVLFCVGVGVYVCVGAYVLSCVGVDDDVLPLFVSCWGE